MVYMASRVGLSHEICEDATLVGTEVLSDTTDSLQIPDTGFICVADGVGGNNGGAEASRFVLANLANSDCTPESLHDELARVNHNLLEKAAATPEAFNMATTLTGVFLQDNSCHLLHVGNTRAYIKQGRYLKQITSDHTTYNWLKSSGQLEAAVACNKNEITNCFGGANPSLLSKLVVSELTPFSLMVLTSDGVHEYVDIDTLEDILFGEGSYEDKCEEILDLARNSGSEDDATIVIIIPEE